MFIKSLTLRDFQSHEKSTFNFDKGLNVLVGVSNVGKSSISRALSLILFNAWDKSWVRFGARYCHVGLETSTGVLVVREKGEKVNKYILTLPEDGIPRTFESFGTVVPEEIQKALNIHATHIDSTDTLNLNFAGQMDALFLLSQTGSYRAKVLGKLSGATYLDHAIHELNLEKRQVTSKKNDINDDISRLKVEIDKFSAIEAYSDIISKFELGITSLDVLEQRLEHVRNILERIKIVQDDLVHINKKIEILDNLVIPSIDTFSRKVDNIKVISILWDKVKKFKPAYVKEDKIRELLASVDSLDLSMLTERITKLKTLSDLAERMKINSVQSNHTLIELQRNESQHESITKQYADALREHGICPTCNQPTSSLCELGGDIR